MSFRYGSIDLATPEGIDGFDKYYTEVRRAIFHYERDANMHKQTPEKKHPAVVTMIHDRFLKTDRRIEKIIGEEFPLADPEGAEAFALYFIQHREFGSNYSRDLLGAIAIRNLCISEPLYPERVCRAAAGLALGNPDIVAMPGSKTMSEFMLINYNNDGVPDADLNVHTLSMLIGAYDAGAFPPHLASS